MTNEHINEWALHAYVDGELSAEQRAEVEALMARDPEAARKVADWIVVFDQGAIIEQGPSAQIFDNPTVERTRTFLNHLGWSG